MLNRQLVNDVPVELARGIQSQSKKDTDFSVPTIIATTAINTILLLLLLLLLLVI